MKKITKEMCLCFVKDYYDSKIVGKIFTSIIVVCILWVITENYFVILVAALTLLTLCIMQGIKNKNVVRNIRPEDFYLEEDVVVDFKKRLYFLRKNAGTKYIYTFEKYGKYSIIKSWGLVIDIPIRKEKSFSHSAINEFSIQSQNKGDQFYLLICDDGKKEIVQIFYRYHFDVKKEDFVYVDGKYYCKEI